MFNSAQSSLRNAPKIKFRQLTNVTSQTSGNSLSQRTAAQTAETNQYPTINVRSQYPKKLSAIRVSNKIKTNKHSGVLYHDQSKLAKSNLTSDLDLAYASAEEQ